MSEEGNGRVAAQARDRSQFPSPGALVSQARQRVAAELEHAPQLHPTLLWGWLRVPGRMETLSPGAITRVVRTFVHAHERALAGELFVMVLERIEGTNRRWAARVLPNAGSVWQDETMRLREDLRQDLTLHLWEHLALRDGEQWELFFWRALDYAQRHIATAFLRKHGLRTHPDTARSTRALSRLIVRLSRYDDDEREAVGLDPPDPTDAFAATDFMDLHGLILELPPVERMVIVMCYWQDATESEIADALGGITTRTVRKYLHLARAHLRAKYQEAGEL